MIVGHKVRQSMLLAARWLRQDSILMCMLANGRLHDGCSSHAGNMLSSAAPVMCRFATSKLHSNATEEQVQARLCR